MLSNSNLPHVTAVLGTLRKPGLEAWFKWNTAAFCDAESNRGKEIGKTIHQAIQQHIEDEEMKFETEYPDEVKNCLKGFFAFKKEYPKIKLKKAEMPIVSIKHGYCGTLDCIASENGNLILIDWKSSKCHVGEKKETDIPKIYEEHEFQVSAYVMAYNEQEKANIEKAGILVLAKDKVTFNYMTLIKSALDERFVNVFLPALSIYNFQKKEKTQNGTNTRQRTNWDSKRDGNSSRESGKLPVRF